jgi:hypothetical protein
LSHTGAECNRYARRSTSEFGEFVIWSHGACVIFLGVEDFPATEIRRAGADGREQLMLSPEA